MARRLTITTVNALAFDPQNSSQLYAATGGEGVFHSADGGATWVAENQGLTDLNVVALGVQSAAPYRVLAVTYAGKGFWTTLPDSANRKLHIKCCMASQLPLTQLTATLPGKTPNPIPRRW